MKCKTKNFTVKFYYYCEEDNMNIYRVINNSTKKAVYCGLYRECVNFVNNNNL